MDKATADRFAEIDALIEATDNRLRVIAAQNKALAEMVEVLGDFVAVDIDVLDTARRRRTQRMNEPRET